MPINKALYHFVSWGFRNLIWRGDLTGAENLPEYGPAILVSNHLGALGPIAVGASVPREFYSWIHADVLDPRLAPDYLRRDFVEPQLHVPSPFSGWIAAGISHIHIPLLLAVGGIPVYHTPEGIQKTLYTTIDLLADGNIVLILPEDPSLPLDPRYDMRPFQKGFTRCGELLFESTGQLLPFYPLAVRPKSRIVVVGKPVWYDPKDSPGHERLRIRSGLEHAIRAMLTD
jgi:hypothetical protein